MDFSVLGGALVALVAAVPAIAGYYQRQARRQRAENRRLRAIVQAADVHLFQLERLGWTSRGVHPPPRPELLRVVTDDEDGGDTPTPARRADTGEAGGEAGGGARHAAP